MGKEGILIVVNKKNRIPDDYNPKLVEIGDSGIKINSLIEEDLNNMIQVAQASDYHFSVGSGYRSIKRQQVLIDEAVKEHEMGGLSHEKALERTYEYMMPVGFSEHHTGLAIDVICDKNLILDYSQANEPTNKWLRENCHKFGFILRYPREKEDITEIVYEPWHFRYVGRDAAEYIMNRGMVLEEYVEDMIG